LRKEKKLEKNKRKINKIEYILREVWEVRKMDWDVGTIIWFIATIVFIGIEIGVPSLVSIWFALASFVLTLISGFIENPINEFYIFVLLSGVFLILTRPLVKKIKSKKNPLEHRIIGQKVKVEKKINENMYQVKLDGKYWRASCETNLRVGEYGRVKKIEGNKLILEKYE
jgi:membrane protein implicated in regulation of membrane protease activity